VLKSTLENNVPDTKKRLSEYEESRRGRLDTTKHIGTLLRDMKTDIREIQNYNKDEEKENEKIYINELEEFNSKISRIELDYFVSDAREHISLYDKDRPSVLEEMQIASQELPGLERDLETKTTQLEELESAGRNKSLTQKFIGTFSSGDKKNLAARRDEIDALAKEISINKNMEDKDSQNRLKVERKLKSTINSINTYNSTNTGNEVYKDELAEFKSKIDEFEKASALEHPQEEHTSGVFSPRDETFN